MKKFFKIIIKSFLILLYIIDICIMFLSSDVVIEWIIAEIKHDGLVLIGLIGMIHWDAIIALIISILIFIIFTVIFVKNKKIHEKII